MRPPWYPDWRGETVVVVGSGPTAATVPLCLARGKARFIAVNNSWRLAPWADILYAADFKWWELNDGCPEFGGLKVSIDRRAGEHPDWGILKLQGHRADNRIDFGEKGHINGRNSGHNAVNLAVQLGADIILLVGFDMLIDYGVHWDGLHPEGMKNPTPEHISSWRRALDGVSDSLMDRGIKVVNCSLVSALKKYPKMTFCEALEVSCRAPAY